MCFLKKGKYRRINREYSELHFFSLHRVGTIRTHSSFRFGLSFIWIIAVWELYLSSIMYNKNQIKRPEAEEVKDRYMKAVGMVKDTLIGIISWRKNTLSFQTTFIFELNIPTPKLFLMIHKAWSERNILLERPGI